MAAPLVARVTTDDADDRPLWRLNNVSVERRLVDATLSIEPGVTAVLGPSGAGKSTLLELLCGLIEPSAGDVLTLFDENRPGNAAVSLLWAGHGDGLWSHLRVFEQISSVGGDPSDWLPRFDLDERRDAYPRTLSQGERSRLEFARALAAEPQILIMDEPLTHVDRRRTATGWEILTEWVRDNERSLIVATHDIAAARQLAQFVICMSDGRVVDAGPLDRVLAEPKCEAAAWAVGAEGASA